MRIHLGHRLSDGTPEGIGTADLLRHLYVLGKTGSGKSTALLRLLSSWMEEGDGLALIDPHGDLAQDLLRRVPKRRRPDVVVIDPADPAWALSWNPLWRVPKGRRPAVAQGLVAAFRGVWSDSWGPRMEYIMVNALRLLLDAEEESLLGLPRILLDSAYRKRLLVFCSDPVVASFWEGEYASWDPRFRREAIAPVQNKIGQFLGDPLIRAILGQRRSRLDLRISMDRGRILVVSLSKGIVGDSTANLLGSLLVASLHEAALSRADIPEDKRRPLLLVADEFQNVATDRFAPALSEARKYGLGLVLSHQFLDQLLPAVREAVLGNAASMLLFRMGGRDAAAFSEEFGPGWPASRFAELPAFHAVLSSVEDGMPVARVVRMAEAGPPCAGDAEVSAMKEASGQRFARPRADIEGRIARWMDRKFR